QTIHETYARQMALPVDHRAMHVTPARRDACVRHHAMCAASRNLLSMTFVSQAVDAAELLYAVADVDGACTPDVAVRAGQLAALWRFGTVQRCDPSHPGVWAQSLYAWWKRCETHGWLDVGGAQHAWALLAQPLASPHPAQITARRLA
ncbi:MAG: hypothetical protein KC983_07790, partial [Phycisphaerales bacterium]|nr:hypothetical protein [Phycisphaerales bacterium]